MAVKNEPTTVLTTEELRKIAVRVCTGAGMQQNALPSGEIINLCLQSWNDKFSLHMNKLELGLAFEMNSNGDIERVEHYGVFSRDFFCKVCQEYLRAREGYNKRQNEKEQAQPKVNANDPEQEHLAIMEAVNDDKELLAKGEPLKVNFRVKTKFEYACTMFDKEVTEQMVKEARGKAVAELIGEVVERKIRAARSKQYGVQAELGHQLVRLREQKLITNEDEAAIQHLAMKYLYMEVLKCPTY